jgi:hypothetical protein
MPLEKSEEKQNPLGGTGVGKITLKEILNRARNMDCMELAQGNVWWGATINTITNFRIHKKD